MVSFFEESAYHALNPSSSTIWLRLSMNWILEYNRFNLSIISAQTATKCIFSASFRMIYAKRAFTRARAFFFTRIICYLMTRFTEMSSAETEPESYCTSIATFELYVVFSMLSTVSHTSTKLQSRAGGTNQIFSFYFKLLLVTVFLFLPNITTFIPTSIVRAFALIAFIER